MHEPNTSAILLAGGMGTRLRAVVSDRPKPMAQVMGKPFIEWLLLQLRAQGVQHIILSTGYMAEAYADYFGDGRRLGLDLTYSHEHSALGTAGAIAHARPHIRSEQVLVMNADSYSHFDLKRLHRAHTENHAEATLWCERVSDASRYGTVLAQPSGKVNQFLEKNSAHGPGLISAGIYCLNTRVIDAFPSQRPLSIEREVFPALLQSGVYSVTGDGPFHDIGTPQAYDEAANVLGSALHQLMTTFTQDEMARRARQHFADGARVYEEVAQTQMTAILSAVDMLVAAFRAGNKLLICGNGGSAADAQHLATEFVSRLTKEFARPALPAIALTTDTSFLTAYANDLDFEGIFDRQVEALGKPGDVLLGLSTSGSSRNVMQAFDRAKRSGIKTLCIVGEGGKMQAHADCAVVVASRSTQHVQEATIAIYHILCDLTERVLYA